jgi:hypothetical protein
VEIARESSRDHDNVSAAAYIASIYHAMRPHIALSPLPVDDATTLAEQENEDDWSQLLVGRIMPLVLPPEDLMNPCLDVLVSEIFSEMIVHNGVLEKATPPWLLWDGITKAIYTLRPTIQPRREPTASPTDRLDQYGLLSSAEGGKNEPSHHTTRRLVDSTISGFWTFLQYAVLGWSLLRVFVAALMHARSIQPRPPLANAKHETREKRELDLEEGASLDHPHAVQPKPVVAMKVWSCLGQLTRLQDRMPWLFGLVSLIQWLSLYGPWQLCSINSALDR